MLLCHQVNFRCNGNKNVPSLVFVDYCPLVYVIALFLFGDGRVIQVDYWIGVGHVGVDDDRWVVCSRPVVLFVVPFSFRF